MNLVEKSQTSVLRQKRRRNIGLIQAWSRLLGVTIFIDTTDARYFLRLAAASSCLKISTSRRITFPFRDRLLMR
jgi:hypothetical protein